MKLKLLLVALVCLFVVLVAFAGIFAALFFWRANSGAAGPVVTVETVYPGASAEVVTNTIAVPIEQQVAGVEKALWLWSRSEDNGKYCLRVAFAKGTDPQQARKLVQDRVDLALPMLPQAMVQGRPTVSFDAPTTRSCAVLARGPLRCAVPGQSGGTEAGEATPASQIDWPGGTGPQGRDGGSCRR